MKKFNLFESYLIEEALTDLINKKEEAVLRYETEGKNNCIFASGYFTMVGKELIDKVTNDMTRKNKYK